jgi:hypothetical protein
MPSGMEGGQSREEAVNRHRQGKPSYFSQMEEADSDTHSGLTSKPMNRRSTVSRTETAQFPLEGTVDNYWFSCSKQTTKQKGNSVTSNRKSSEGATR